MTRFLFTLVFCIPLASSSPGMAQEQSSAPYLPTGPQPYQSLASVDAGGKLTLKTPVANWQAKSFEDPAAKRVLTYYVAVTTYVDRHYQLNQVQAYDYRGNPIGAKRLRELLQEAVPVLVSADGRPVDPLHLRLYKKDVILLVAPVAAQQLPQIISAQTPATPPTALYAPDNPSANEAKPRPPAALTMILTGPTKAALQTNSVYLLSITNSGGAKADKVRVRVELPEQLLLVDADEGLKKEGTFESEVGDLAPGATRVLDLKVRAQQKGEFVVRASATSAEPKLNASAEHRCNIVDAPAPAIEKKQAK